MSVALKERVETIDVDGPPSPNLPAVVEQRGLAQASQPSSAGYYPPSIARALVAVARAAHAIGKKGHNNFHNYDYQRWEDVLNELSPLIAEHGLFIMPSEIHRSLLENEQLVSVTYAFTIGHESGEVWPDRPQFSAIAKVRDGKGQVDDKAANKCHTQAHKYFLLHLFKIRTQEAVTDDSDGDGGDQREAAGRRSPRTVEARSAPAQEDVQKAEPAAWKMPRNPVNLREKGISSTTFRDRFIACINAAQSAVEVGQWKHANADDGLAILAKKFEDLHREVEQAIAARLDALAGPADPDDDGPPAPSDGPPSPTDGASDLEKHIMGEIARLPGYDRALAWGQENVGKLKALPAPAYARVNAAFLARQQEFNPNHTGRR